MPVTIPPWSHGMGPGPKEPIHAFPNACRLSVNIPAPNIEPPRTPPSYPATEPLPQPQPPPLLRPAKRARIIPATRPLTDTELGKYAVLAERDLHRLGWHRFVRSRQGARCVASTIHTLPHSATPYLDRLRRTGVPVLTVHPPWTTLQRDQAVARGPHASAAAIHREFLCTEMLDMVRRRYWTVLPYRAVRRLPSVKVAPFGVVPQRDRRPRPIVDYSWNLVNQHSAPLAPTRAMQFGHALQRVLQRIVYANPAFGPVYLMKLDLADGYYRVPLATSGVPHLGVILPYSAGEEPIIAFPLTLPMGWSHSPPYFCAFTETGADVCNHLSSAHPRPPFGLPPHALEPVIDQVSLPQSPPENDTTLVQPPHSHLTSPVEYVDVYIDDFLAMAQTAPVASRLRRLLLHTVDRLFRPNHPSDDPSRKEPISRSKIDKGDATWATTKIILGWLIDTVSQTIQLPHHRRLRLQELLTLTLTKSRVSRRNWMRLLGELRSMIHGIVGGAHMLSFLQHALAGNSRIRLTPFLRSCLHDWWHLADELAEHPTPLRYLVPTRPTYVGTSDASKQGMGGVWLPTDPANSGPEAAGQLRAFAWRCPFPPAIQRQLVSFDNPRGTITNSDLELAGIVTASAMLAAATPLYFEDLLIGSDNTPAVAWTNKCSTTTAAAPAYLLRLQGLIARQHRFTPRATYVQGDTNAAADFCSRSFHLTDADLLLALDTRFPLSQGLWQLRHPTPALTSSILSALSRKMSVWESPPLAPPRPPVVGPTGATSANTSTSTPPWNPTPTPSQPCSSTRVNIDVGRLLPPNVQWALEQWNKPFAPWGRRWPGWDGPTHGSTPRVTLTSVFNAN